MLTTLDPRTLLRNGIDELGCAANNYQEITELMSKSKLALCLSGQREFTHDEGVRALYCLDELKELAASSQTQPDWKQTERIRAALEQRRQIRKLVSDVQKAVVEFIRVGKTLRTGKTHGS